MQMKTMSGKQSFLRDLSKRTKATEHLMGEEADRQKRKESAQENPIYAP